MRIAVVDKLNPTRSLRASDYIKPEELDPTQYPPKDEYGEELKYRWCSACGETYDQHDSNHRIGGRCEHMERILGR